MHLHIEECVKVRILEKIMTFQFPYVPLYIIICMHSITIHNAHYILSGKFFIHLGVFLYLNFITQFEKREHLFIQKKYYNYTFSLYEDHQIQRTF